MFINVNQTSKYNSELKGNYDINKRSSSLSNFFYKNPCQSAISIKLQNNFIEIVIRHGCFPVNLLLIFRTLFSKNISGGLLLTRVM